MAKTIFAKGWLVDCNKTSLTAMSDITHKATHRNTLSHTLKNLVFAYVKRKMQVKNFLINCLQL